MARESGEPDLSLVGMTNVSTRRGRSGSSGSILNPPRIRPWAKAAYGSASCGWGTTTRGDPGGVARRRATGLCPHPGAADAGPPFRSWPRARWTRCSTVFGAWRGAPPAPSALDRTATVTARVGVTVPEAGPTSYPRRAIASRYFPRVSSQKRRPAW